MLTDMVHLVVPNLRRLCRQCNSDEVKKQKQCGAENCQIEILYALLRFAIIVKSILFIANVRHIMQQLIKLNLIQEA